MQRRRARGRSIYYRAAISLILVAMVSLFVSFSFFYPRTLNAARTRILEQRNYAMQQTVLTMDRLFSQAVALSTTVEKASVLRPYNLDGGSVATLLDAKQLIAQLCAPQDNLYAMFYHVLGSDYLIGNGGTIAMDSFGRDVWSMSGLSQAELHRLMENPGDYHLHILPETLGCPDKASRRHSVLPFATSISSQGRAYASLLFLFDAERVASEMSRSWQNDAVFLTDGERILFSSNSSLTDALTSEQLSASAEGEALTDGSALYLSPSAMFGFSYGVVCRSDAVQAELSSLRTVMTVFMLAALAGISLLTALISRWNYQPVRQFCADIGVDLSAPRSDSELLRARFEDLMQSNRELAENLQSSHQMLEDAILQRLLVSIPQERRMWIDRAVNAGVFAGAIRCTVAICLSDRPDRAQPPADPRFVLHRISSRGHDVLLLFHCTAETGDSVASTYFALHFPGCRICCAPLCEGWSALPDAYETLLKHLPALCRIEPAVVPWDAPCLEMPPETPFGEDALRELAESLRTQSADDMRFAASLLSACLGEENHSVPELQMLTIDALQMICGALERGGLLSASALERMNPLSQGRLDDPRRMKALLSSAVEIALTSFPKNDFARRNQLSQDVLLYIEEHLLDPSFSIYTISETFGLSESAFSHLFKRTFHETYSSYVSKQKLIRAFDLLCDESIPLEEVAIRLGYSRSSNFGRMFKAEVGMSPGRYRSLHSQGNPPPDAPDCAEQ